MTASNNWIHDKTPSLTINDKLKQLLTIRHKLVLVQEHELERVKRERHKDRYAEYIEQLYIHYVINGLPKTYLMK